MLHDLRPLSAYHFQYMFIFCSLRRSLKSDFESGYRSPIAWTAGAMRRFLKMTTMKTTKKTLTIISRKSIRRHSSRWREGDSPRVARFEHDPTDRSRLADNVRCSRKTSVLRFTSTSSPEWDQGCMPYRTVVLGYINPSIAPFEHREV